MGLPCRPVTADCAAGSVRRVRPHGRGWVRCERTRTNECAAQEHQLSVSGAAMVLAGWLFRRARARQSQCGCVISGRSVAMLFRVGRFTCPTPRSVLAVQRVDVPLPVPLPVPVDHSALTARCRP